MIVHDPEAPNGERAKVLDFGIAKLADSGPGSGMEVKTRTGAMMGTPLYMSPEQCRGTGSIDDRSDVYSLGIMMYQMLAGTPPFVSEGLGELVVKHMLEKPRPLREQVPGLSPGLEALVHAMLAKTPAERPSMNQVLGEINQLGQNLPGWASTLRPPAEQGGSFPTGSGVMPVPHPSTLGQSAGQRQPSFLSTAAGGPGAARTRAIVISAVAGLLAVGTLVAVLPKRQKTAQQPIIGMPQLGTGVPNRPTLPNGMSISPNRVDASHIDLAAFYKLALQEAHDRAPDASLTGLLARCVQPDGIANLNLCSGALVYTFRSPSKSVRGNTPIGVPLSCLVQVIVQPSIGLLVQNSNSERCEEKLMQSPRCQPADIWRRARKGGAPENAIADVSLIDGKWYITVDGKSQIFPDNC